MKPSPSFNLIKDSRKTPSPGPVGTEGTCLSDVMRDVTTRWRPLSIALYASWPGLWSYNGEIQGSKLCLLKCPEHTTPAAVALEWHFRKCMNHSVYLITNLLCLIDYAYFLNVC